jgi:type I restriction enzyme S subunit
MDRAFTRIKRVAVLRAGGTPAVDDPALWNDQDGLPWVAIGDMTREDPVMTTERQVSAEGVSAKRLPIGASGTLLFAMYASVGTVARLGVQASWNQAILGVDPMAGRSDGRFLRYWLDHVRPTLVERFRSNTQDNLNAEQVANLPFPVCSEEWQKAIADMLDSETARIDALVEKKRWMIDLLEERRVAITIAGMTNPAWPRVKLTLLARLGSGHTPSRGRPDWWENPTIPWVTTGDVAQMRGDRIEFIENTKLSISELGLANSAAELHPAGTVVLSRTASVGFSAIMARPMATSQDFATWTCGAPLRPRFLLLCLRAMRSELLGRLAMGSTHKTIYMPDIEGIRLVLPTLEEQERVVDEVWEQLRPIDATVKALRGQIELLREHRQALITAAVTGELDVGKAAV